VKTCSLHSLLLLNCAYHDLNAIKLQDGYSQSRPEELLTRIKLAGVKSYFPFFSGNFFYHSDCFLIHLIKKSFSVQFPGLFAERSQLLKVVWVRVS
jgi:hypothetical protein